MAASYFCASMSQQNFRHIQTDLLNAQIPSTATTVSLEATGSGVGLVQVRKNF